MTEWGLFSDEGCVERGIWSREEAEAALLRYDPDDELVALPMCELHEEPAASCPSCLND
jgi:hypothetical protein